MYQDTRHGIVKIGGRMIGDAGEEVRKLCPRTNSADLRSPNHGLADRGALVTTIPAVEQPRLEIERDT